MCTSCTFILSASSAFASAASSSLNGFTKVVAPVILISCTQQDHLWPSHLPACASLRDSFVLSATSAIRIQALVL